MEPARAPGVFSLIVPALSAAGILVILAPGIGNVRARETSVRDGVYTEAQAERGSKTFDRVCIECHDPSRFVGELMKPWENQSALPLFDAICRTMPEDNPGTLPRQPCADILSHIFRLNGFKAGSEELKGTDEAMRAVRIEGF